jgi:hypothetical protein
LVEGNCECIFLAIFPIAIGNRESRLDKARKEIRRREDFHPILLWVLGIRGVASNRILGIRTGYHYSPIS